MTGSETLGFDWATLAMVLYFLLLVILAIYAMTTHKADEDERPPLPALELTQTERHKAYDLTQRLTFFVIGLEVVACGYILINADKFSKAVKYIDVLYLFTGVAVISGIAWRFCYNQTFHERSHGQESKHHETWCFVQRLTYVYYLVSTALFFLGVLYWGLRYLASFCPP